MKLSIIIPVYNSEKTITPLFETLKEELTAKFDLEIVLINDGSLEDNSAKVCVNIASKNKTVKFIDLSRNFREHNAVMAGLNYCTGDVAVIIDDDFQNPPSEIVKLVDRLNDGYDVVFSKYSKKHHHPLRNIGSRINNRFATTLIGKPKDLYLSSFKAINRFLIDEVVKYKGPYPYLDGLILRSTCNYDSVETLHNPRAQGKSGYTTQKLISLWLNMFTSFSILPLRAATLMGFIFSGIGLLGAVYFVLERLHNTDVPLGWATLIVSLLILTGVQLFAIGMIGEYLGRLFMKDSGKPQFIVRRTLNCGPEKDDDR